MKDFISKLTFGFLMAQFVPGAILVYSISFIVAVSSYDIPQKLSRNALTACGYWADSAATTILFIAFSIVAGMAVHGLNWAVIGFLEHRYRSLFDAPWYKIRILFQYLIAPLIILCEIVCFFLQGKNIRDVAVEENVPFIEKRKMEAFQFIQEFYLHFSQFYAHTSYSLIVALIAIAFAGWKYRFAGTYLELFLATYLVCGYFFITGRIQLQCLFKGEEGLRTADIDYDGF